MLIKAKKHEFNISKKEIKDLTKAWIILSLAFAIVFQGLSFTYEFFLAFLVAAITVGTAFIFHELGHKLIAQKYGCFAEFRSFDNMLFLALLMSFFGFIFAAPGAVMISGPVGVKRNGKISAMGPGINLSLAVIFLIFHFLSPNVITFYGFLVNSWLGLFNLIPFAMFDGKKILRWNKFVYGMMVGIALILMMLQSVVRI
jgi:Zn-dependent protease